MKPMYPALILVNVDKLMEGERVEEGEAEPPTGMRVHLDTS